MVRRKKDEDVELVPAPEPEVPEEKPAPEPEPVAPPLPKGPVKYEVVENWQGSISGQVTKLKKGKVIQDRYYGGQAGIAKLRDAGLQLRQL